MSCAIITAVCGEDLDTTDNNVKIMTRKLFDEIPTKHVVEFIKSAPKQEDFTPMHTKLAIALVSNYKKNSRL